MRLQYIGGSEKALEAFRVQYRPVLVFAGHFVHAFDIRAY
jgi:hypothetical protein